MADYQSRTELAAPAQRTFDYLSEVSNLPDYFDRMTSARPGDGETVQTTAKLPNGTEVEGEAWFRVDTNSMALSWGSEGTNDYHGRLEVTGDERRSVVTVTVSTARAETEQIQRGLDETVATIGRRLTAV
jgi:uncharacterized membrane protein